MTEHKPSCVQKVVLTFLDSIVRLDEPDFIERSNPVLAKTLRALGLQSSFHAGEQSELKKGTIKKYGDVVYVVYYDIGLALSFTKIRGQDQHRLDAIEFYNFDNQYRPTPESLLPFEGILPDTTAAQFVEAYSEPSEKGGGIMQHIDIWMRWDDIAALDAAAKPSRRVGLEVQINDRSWDTGQSSKWKSMTVFLSDG